MKTLINLFIIITLVFSFSSVAKAQDDTQDQPIKNPEKIRIINVDVKKYQGEYDRAIDSDPWKGFNLAMFKFNNAIDQYFLEPVARGYGNVVPQWGRDRVSNIFNNLGEPRNFANSLLQGDVEGMFRSFWRLVINTGFGVGGMHDVAGGFGLKDKDKGFSQTLAFYDIGSGPYLVVPFMGPSTPRDLVGSGGDIAANPATYLDEPANYVVGGLDAIQTREKLLNVTDDMKKNSFDLYSAYKSSYLQHRKKKVLETLE